MPRKPSQPAAKKTVPRKRASRSKPAPTTALPHEETHKEPAGSWIEDLPDEVRGFFEAVGEASIQNAVTVPSGDSMAAGDTRPDLSPSPGMDMPKHWMDHILAVIRTTANAAIIDYHNVQISPIEEELSSLRTTMERLAARLDEIAPEQADRAVKVPEPSPTVPAAARGVQETSPRLTREDVTWIIRETVAEQLRIGALPPAVPVPPPSRPRSSPGSRPAGERERLQGSCDTALFELFEHDRKTRGYTTTQMIEFILYNFYQRPCLSFEDAEEQSEAGTSQP